MKKDHIPTMILAAMFITVVASMRWIHIIEENDNMINYLVKFYTGV